MNTPKRGNKTLSSTISVEIKGKFRNESLGKKGKITEDGDDIPKTEWANFHNDYMKGIQEDFLMGLQKDIGINLKIESSKSAKKNPLDWTGYVNYGKLYMKFIVLNTSVYPLSILLYKNLDIAIKKNRCDTIELNVVYKALN